MQAGGRLRAAAMVAGVLCAAGVAMAPAAAAAPKADHQPPTKADKAQAPAHACVQHCEDGIGGEGVTTGTAAVRSTPDATGGSAAEGSAPASRQGPTASSSAAGPLAVGHADYVPAPRTDGRATAAVMRAAHTVLSSAMLLDKHAARRYETESHVIRSRFGNQPAAGTTVTSAAGAGEVAALLEQAAASTSAPTAPAPAPPVQIGRGGPSAGASPPPPLNPVPNPNASGLETAPAELMNAELDWALIAVVVALAVGLAAMIRFARRSRGGAA